MLLPKVPSAAQMMYTGDCTDPLRHGYLASLAVSGHISEPHRPTLPVWAGGSEIEDFCRGVFDLGVRARMETSRTVVRTACDPGPATGVLVGGDPLAAPNGWRIPSADTRAERLRAECRPGDPIGLTDFLRDRVVTLALRAAQPSQARVAGVPQPAQRAPCGAARIGVAAR